MSCWSSAKFLFLSQKLHKLGVNFKIKPGVKIGRGFADLGVEEFCVLPGNKLVSLFTGEKSELPNDYEEHFFVIPNSELLVEKLIELGISIPDFNIEINMDKSIEEVLISIILKKIDSSTEIKSQLIAV